MKSENSEGEVTNCETILIVDDSISDLQVFLTFLEDSGFRVLTAQNGENGLRIAQSRLPDLILLDIVMSGIDGFEVCHRLKAKTSTRKIPIIFMVDILETVSKTRGFELGGVDCILKSIEEAEILARIRTHLNIQKKFQNLRKKLRDKKRQLQQEIYHRERVERQQALLRQINQKIRDSLDETQILQTVTEELANILQINICKIELYDESHALATVVYEYTNVLPKSQGMVRKIADFPELYNQLLETISIQFVELIPTISPKVIQFTRLACPIFVNDGSKIILGNFWLLKPREEVFEEFEIQLVKQVASHCAIAIRQARLYKASQQQVLELEKLNRLKDDFLRSLSHELRSPVSSMQLAVQTIEKLIQREFPEKKSTTLNRVINIFRQAYQRHNKLVEDLLTLCYLDANPEAITSELINLQVLIPEIAQPFFERTQYQQLEFVIDLPTELPLLNSNISILDRILIELLNNAFKYTPSGETVTLEVRVTDELVKLSVINSGVVIPESEQNRIFEQFYRIPNNDPWQFGGTGLGLTLVKKMTSVLEGTIELESGNGRTKFSLLLASS